MHSLLELVTARPQSPAYPVKRRADKSLAARRIAIVALYKIVSDDKKRMLGIYVNERSAG